MIRQNKVRGILAGTLAVGLSFIIAGAAFACTKFYGEITGTGNGPINSPTSIAGNADGGTFQWCEDPHPFDNDPSATVSLSSDTERTASKSGPPAWEGWDTQVDYNAARLTVSVAASTECLETLTETNVLPQGTYKVGISEGYWDESTEGFHTTDEDNCHTLELGGSGQVGNGKIIDTNFVVDANGNGTETYTGTNGNIAGDTSSKLLRQGWNTVCVYWPAGNQTLDEGFFQPANALNFRA